jgi:hypothetical protein
VVALTLCSTWSVILSLTPLMRIPKPVWDYKMCAKFVPTYGWIRDYLAYATQCTDAPPIYHILSAIGVMGLAISPSHALSVNGEHHPLHIFLLIVGESGNRKSAAIKRCLRVIRPCLIASKIDQRIWYPEASTAEGIITGLIEDPCRLLIASEWTEYHNQGKASYNQHTREFTNLLYDGEPLHRLKMGQQLVVPKPCVSILGASTPSLIKQATTIYDWEAGKLARYVVGYQSKPDDIEMISAVEHPALVTDLRLNYSRMLAPSLAGDFALSQDAWNFKMDWEQGAEWIQFRKSLPVHLTPSALRVSEHVYRIAALYQASMTYPHSTVVGAEAMERAILLMRWCMEGLRKIFTVLPSTENNVILRVLQAIQMYGDKGVIRRDLMRQTHLNGPQLTMAIKALQEREQVAVWANGTKTWYAIKEDRPVSELNESDA